MPTPEGKVKAEVDKLLKKYNVWYFKPVSLGYGKHGIPDYICCHNGRFFAIEVKAKDGMQMTVLQKRQMIAITEAGGDAWGISPSWLPSLEQYLAVNGNFGNMSLEFETAKWKRQGRKVTE